ncbi:MAG: sel1 repeat family protein [Myxococcales bacterium]|nr:sel1 repeat family protein [Myxococcales bacterium]
MRRWLAWAAGLGTAVLLTGALAWNRIDHAPRAAAPGAPPSEQLELARAGDVAAQFAVAASQLGTPTVARDVPQSLYWFGQAAQAGHARAQSALGHMLMRGRLVRLEAGERERWVEVDEDVPASSGLVAAPSEAMDWLARAAEQGEVDAQERLGLALERGEAGDADPARAKRWFRRAAREGSVVAQLELSRLYDAGAAGERYAAEAAT